MEIISEGYHVILHMKVEIICLVALDWEPYRGRM